MSQDMLNFGLATVPPPPPEFPLMQLLISETMTDYNDVFYKNKLRLVVEPVGRVVDLLL